MPPDPTQPTTIPYRWSPRRCASTALALDATGLHRDGLLADRITTRLEEAGGDAAPVVVVTLTAHELTRARLALTLIGVTP